MITRSEFAYRVLAILALWALLVWVAHGGSFS